MNTTANPLRTGQVRAYTPPFAQAYAHRGIKLAHVGVPGDGSCFFHSVCAALNHLDYNQKSAAEKGVIGRSFRCTFNKNLTPAKWASFLKRHDPQKRHPQYHAASLAELRTWFCDGKRWADELMIKYVSEELKLDIMFVDASKGSVYCGVRGRDEHPVIVVLWLDHSHFEPMMLVLEHKKLERQVRGKMMFHPVHDKKYIDAIRSMYNQQCPA
jgi:hypothetical protein